MNSVGEKEPLRAVCWAHTAVCLFPESARGPVGLAALDKDFLPPVTEAALLLPSTCEVAPFPSLSPLLMQQHRLEHSPHRQCVWLGAVNRPVNPPRSTLV